MKVSWFLHTQIATTEFDSLQLKHEPITARHFLSTPVSRAMSYIYIYILKLSCFGTSLNGSWMTDGFCMSPSFCMDSGCRHLVKHIVKLLRTSPLHQDFFTNTANTGDIYPAQNSESADLVFSIIILSLSHYLGRYFRE